MIVSEEQKPNCCYNDNQCCQCVEYGNKYTSKYNGSVTDTNALHRRLTRVDNDAHSTHTNNEER